MPGLHRAADRWALGLPGAYLTDGRRLVQVLFVEETELACEDVSAPAYRAAPIVKVRISDVGPVWRRVHQLIGEAA